MKKLISLCVALVFITMGIFAQNSNKKKNNEKDVVVVKVEQKLEDKDIKKVPKVKKKQKPKKLKKISKKQALLQKQKIRQNFRRKLRNAK